MLVSFSFEISTTISDSSFDLYVVGLLKISLVKLCSIAHGLNLLFLIHFASKLFGL